jgi:hypothetical protein
MDVSSEIVKSPWQRFVTLTRSPVFLLAFLAGAASLWSAFIFYLEKQQQPIQQQELREQLQQEQPRQLENAEAALSQAGTALKYVQSVGGKFDLFLDEVARRSENLPNPNDRASLAQETQLYRSLMNDVNAKVLAALNDISTYEANRPRQHSSTSILSIAASAQTIGSFAQTPPAPSLMSSTEGLRPFIMFGILIAITVFFFICVRLYCFTADADKIKFADNMMRTIVGFYIGIVTGLLGLPGK